MDTTPSMPSCSDISQAVKQKMATPKLDSKSKNEQRVLDFLRQVELKREKNSEKQPLDVKDFQIGLQIGQGAFASVRRSVHKES